LQLELMEEARSVLENTVAVEPFRFVVRDGPLDAEVSTVGGVVVPVVDCVDVWVGFVGGEWGEAVCVADGAEVAGALDEFLEEVKVKSVVHLAAGALVGGGEIEFAGVAEDVEDTEGPDVGGLELGWGLEPDVAGAEPDAVARLEGGGGGGMVFEEIAEEAVLRKV